MRKLHKLPPMKQVFALLVFVSLVYLHMNALFIALNIALAQPGNWTLLLLVGAVFITAAWHLDHIAIMIVNHFEKVIFGDLLENGK